MAGEEIDLGELIRDLLGQEQRIITEFEHEEASVEQSRKEIESKIAKILKTQREHAQDEANKMLVAARKSAEAEADRILKKQEAEVKKLQVQLDAQRKLLVDASLSKIVEGVVDAVSAKTL